LTTSLPAGTVAGDVIVSFVDNEPAVTATGPAGSNEVINATTGSGYSGATLTAFVSVVAAGQTSTSVTIVPDNGAAMLTDVFSGATAYGAAGKAAKGLDSPSVSASSGDMLVLGEGSSDWNVTATAPSGSTSPASVTNGQGNQTASADVPVAATGATSSFAWGGNETAADSLSAAIDLRPASQAPAVAISTNSLGGAIQGSAYSATLSASGGNPPYTWTATGLPAGLSLSGDVISGTPTATGTSNVTLTVTSSAPVQTASVTLPLTVSAQSATCITSDFHGFCPATGSYTDPSIVSNTANPGALTVSPNVWGPISGETATLYANGPANWYTTFNVPAGNTSVTAFPNVGELYNEQPLSDYTSLTSSFSENENVNPGTDGWAAYDNWFNNYGNEVMIQHDFANGGNGPCGDTTGVYDVPFGGSNGVPVQDWQLCQFGSEIIWQLSAPGTHNLMNEQSGSVDLLAMTQWLETHGYLPANSTITGLSYGWEICSTGGVPENFQLNNFTITGTT
jgi:hypothetical protein